MNYPTEIYADTDLVCGVEPKEGHQKYVRSDAQMFHDKSAAEAAEELIRLRHSEKAMQAWSNEVTSALCYQPDIPHDHKKAIAESFAAYMESCGVAVMSTQPCPNCREEIVAEVEKRKETGQIVCFHCPKCGGTWC